MKKIKLFIFVLFSMILSFASVNVKAEGEGQGEGEETPVLEHVVINANSSGEATNVFDVVVKNEAEEETPEEGEGTEPAPVVTEKKQFTRTRDITLTINASEEILNKYDSFVVCEVLRINDDEEKIVVGIDECPKYSLSNKVHNYQLRSPYDGEKEIYIIYDYEGKSKWSQAKDLITKNIVLDTTGPVININNGEYVYVTFGNTYTEMGAECIDDSLVSIEGGCSVVVEDTQIDKNKEGYQYIRYTATDFLGNETNVLRKVMMEVKTEEKGIDLYWYVAGGLVFIVAGFLTVKVIKNKDKQKNQSVL